MHDGGGPLDTKSVWRSTPRSNARTSNRRLFPACIRDMLNVGSKGHGAISPRVAFSTSQFEETVGYFKPPKIDLD
jgi:hypothetical protein